VASTIASDYESWKYLRRAIKWYNAYQQCMACYLFLQFEENFKRRMDTVMCDSEELDCRQRDQLINHAQVGAHKLSGLTGVWGGDPLYPGKAQSLFTPLGGCSRRGRAA
jgi:hypothetical protein